MDIGERGWPRVRATVPRVLRPRIFVGGHKPLFAPMLELQSIVKRG